MQSRACSQCGAGFEVRYPSSKKKACSYECRSQLRHAKRPTRSDKGVRKASWVTVQCAHCRQPFERAPHYIERRKKKGWQLYCSWRCRDAACLYGTHRYGRPNSGRKTVTIDGYIEVYVPAEDRPPGKSKQARFHEHRVVMAKKLGRHLLPNETVHHIDGDRTNNAPENLQLRRGRHGNGSAFRCCDCGSHNIEAVSLADKTQES